VQGSQVPCVFEDDVETAVDLAYLQLMSVTSIELSRRELDETMEDSLVVCNQGINYKYVYEMMYGRYLFQSNIRLYSKVKINNIYHVL